MSKHPETPKFQHEDTGDVVEFPPPDILGQSTIIFNGRIVERILYSDDGDGSVTVQNGKVFTCDEWSKWVAEQLKTGAWKLERPQ